MEETNKDVSSDFFPSAAGEEGNDSFFCRFLSAHAKRKEFFVGGTTSVKTLPISWHDGKSYVPLAAQQEEEGRGSNYGSKVVM